MSESLDPYILNQINKYLYEGKNLVQIIENYENDLDLDAEFLTEIKACYHFAKKNMKLRDYQFECVHDTLDFFSKNENINYQLRWCCGLGKTKTTCSILKLGDFHNICIGLPSLLLLDQFYEELKLFFPETKILKLGGKTGEEGDISNSLINQTQIMNYLTSEEEYKIVLSTYHSSQKIFNTGFQFDIVVGDEAHHLECKQQKKFNYFLKIPSNKRLFLTATPNLKNETKSHYSFENSDIFKGGYNTKTVRWAIENRYVSDYRLIILNMSHQDLKEFQKLIDKYENKDLVLAGYMAVKAIYEEISSKILIYCNQIKNSETVCQIIDDLLKEHNNKVTEINKNGTNIKVLNVHLNGTHKLNHRTNIINAFKREEFGIISSVQLFGEGFDYPSLDSVLFAEKMTSDIRIVQSGLRPCRIDKRNPDKIANILIPIKEDEFSKVKQVLMKLKEIDDIRSKLAVINNSDFTKKYVRKLINHQKVKIPDNIKRILTKIEFKILDDSEVFQDLPCVKSSKITKCILNNRIIDSKKLKYKSILLEIFKLMGKEIILKTTNFNVIDDNIKGTNGFHWNEDLKISIQNKDGNNTFLEILRLVKINQYKIRIEIKLKNKKNIIVNFNQEKLFIKAL